MVEPAHDEQTDGQGMGNQYAVFREVGFGKIAVEGAEQVIRIRDYGPGIPEDELPMVKKKFYKGSSKARGSGIGLAVCEEIIVKHGGELKLENAEGGGTLVTISLPVGEE